MRKLFFLLLLVTTPAYAQEVEPDLEAFLKRFPKTTLPYTCKVNPKAKFKKTSELSKEDAQNFLIGFKTPQGFNVDYYQTLIEPFPLYKNEEGKEHMDVSTGQIIALLKRTDAYILFVTRVAFEQKGFENVSGEQYLLYSITPTGLPIHVVPIAQKVQFDLHSNQTTSKIDKDGNITVEVEVYTVSGTEKKTEKYKIEGDGKIVSVK
jgi:hypothetical protein